MSFIWLDKDFVVFNNTNKQNNQVDIQYHGRNIIGTMDVYVKRINLHHFIISKVV